MSIRRKKLFFKLYPSYLLVALVSLFAVTWYASTSIKSFYLAQVRTDIESTAEFLKGQIDIPLSFSNLEKLRFAYERPNRYRSMRITVIKPDGKVVYDSEKNISQMGNHKNRAEVKQVFQGQATGYAIRFSNTANQDMMYVAVPVQQPGENKISAVLRISVPVSAIDKVIKSVYMKIAIGGMVIAFFVALLSIFISYRISRPIKELKESASLLTRENASVKLSLYGIEEIDELAETINKMSENLNNRLHEITKSRNELEVILSSMLEGLIALDKEKRVINMNKSALTLLSVRDNPEGKSLEESVRNTALLDFIYGIFASPSEQSFEEDFTFYGEKTRFLQARGTILKDSWNNKIGALVVLNDITRIKKLENLRRDFVANVSHELKTPLTVIKGAVETLIDSALRNPEDAKRFAGIISKHTDRLNAIIEDILSLSRIEEEAEKGEINLARNNIAEALKTAVDLCMEKAERKNIRIETACSSSLYGLINRELFEQAIVNLIDNAVKYSDEGSTVELKASTADNKINISVIDKGCGIPEEYLPRLFERFYRVDKARSRKLGGTGLGLAIVKHIVEANRGSVEVKSELGKGSTFTIILPSQS